jgi:hypothetical protein
VGHIRLGTLPKSKKWQQVVALLGNGADVAEIAAAAADAAGRDLRNAADDPVLHQTVWLLTQLPLAARDPAFAQRLRELGLPVSDRPGLFELLAGYSEAVDNYSRQIRSKSDLGEMALLSASESVGALLGRSLPGLFEPTFEEVRQALANLGTTKNFSVLAREFFSRLTQRRLEYYLARELSNHVGPGARFNSIADHADFRRALDEHCREASRIVKEFSGEWFSKTVWKGALTPAAVHGFVIVAFRKIGAELRKR